MASRRMEWNPGRWLGAQLGSTVWMLVAGLLSLRSDIGTALVVIGLFVLANACGLLIWRGRDRLSAYSGIQMLLPIVGVAGLAAVYALERAGIWEAIQVGGTVSARATYGIIILTLMALMLLLHFQFGRKR